MMNKRALLIIPGLFFFAMLGLLLFGLGRNPSMVPSALVNRPLPEFSLPSLGLDVAETIEPIRSEDLLGGISIINFWATWCPPCHIEHPYLVEISEREQGVSFVGVNYKDDLDEARLFLDEKGHLSKKLLWILMAVLELISELREHQKLLSSIVSE